MRLSVRNSKQAQCRARTKGFLLLEVVLSVLVIGAGLLLIICSYMTSLRGAAISNALTKASFILENKLFDLDIQGFKDGVKEGELSDIVENEKNYSWNFNACPLDNKETVKIDKVDLNVMYKIGGQDRKIGISTFLKQAKEE